jgi:fungalysin metallopeptidase (M36)
MSNLSFPRPRRLHHLVMPTVLLFLSAVQAGSVSPDPIQRHGDYRTTYDVRSGVAGISQLLDGGYTRRELDAMAESGRNRLDLARTALAEKRAARESLEVSRDPLTGSAEVVRNPRGFLTAPKLGRAADIAISFLRENAALYGLTTRDVDSFRTRGESLSPRSGIRMVRLEQTVRGLPVFQSETRVIEDGKGRLVRTVGRLVPVADESLVPTRTGMISAPDALAVAMRSVGLELDPLRMEVRASANDSGSQEVIVHDSRVVRPVTSREVYFPLAPGVLVPAWSQVTSLKGLEGYYTVVEGRTGTLLFRKSLLLQASAEEARFAVYSRLPGLPTASPAPGAPNSLRQNSTFQYPAISRGIESMAGVQDPVASPDGWIPDGGSTTTGNNADAFLDRDADSAPDLGTLDLDGRPVGNPDVNGRNRDFLGASPRDFNYTPAPLGSNPDAGDDPSTAPFQRGSVTELFYLFNYAHDRFYSLGFDEAAGNSQTDNFGRGGLGGDPLLGAANYAAGLGFFNATGTLAAPDGTSVYIGFGIQNGPTPFRDVDLDAEVVLHEYTHSVTTRIVGDAAGLNFHPGGGLGEGWSDFFALSLLHDQPSDDPDAQYPVSAYFHYKFRHTFLGNYVYGSRRFPYSTDKRVNPLTWADADPTTFDLSGGFTPSSNPLHPRDQAFEVHNLGEIWATNLWEMRSRIIAANGGNVPLGNGLAMQLVLDGVKLTPVDPSFTDARDAILDADCAANACANEDSIWGAFADRGLGYGAGTSSGRATQIGVAESYSLPALSAGSVILDDSAGNNNGFIDPGETISMRVGLFNPWRSAAKGIASATAILSTHTMAVGSISDKNSAYGPIPAQGTTLGDPFVFTVSAKATCGQSLAFTLKISTAAGTSSADFAVRVGRPTGPGAPVVFSRVVPHGGLAIPDGNVRGVADTMSINADLVIDDLDFQLDSLAHTFVGDLTLGLKAPTGFASSLIDRLASCSSIPCSNGQNSGDNFVGTRIDDGATGDLYAAGPAAAPFTGSWFPTLNSPLGGVFFPQDPDGELGKFNGLSTQGTWTVWLGDFKFGDTGTLNGWSLVVTPETFACGP